MSPPLPTEPTWPWLDPIADAVNPAIGLLILVLAVRAAADRRWREALGLPITLVILLGVTYSLAYVERVFGLFALFGLDFSTHGAVHLAAWTAILVWQPRRWAWALATAIGYHALMLAQDYHTALDLLGTAALTALPLSVLATGLRPLARRRADSGPTAQNTGA